MPKPLHKSFAAQVRQLPHFDFESELAGFQEHHGDGLALLEARIEAKLVEKEVGCRLYADTLGFAHVDPFSSLITEEAIATIPVEIAKKIRVLGLYVIEGVLTAAFATPEEADTVKRLSQIVPFSPCPAISRTPS